MILSCPSCAARFVVDAGALRPNGRQVKCGKCAHQWREVAPPPEEQPPLVNPTADIVPPPLEPPQSFRKRANLPAFPEKPKRRRSGVVALALVASILIVAMGILWFGRAPLTELWPAAGQLYAAIGIEATDKEPALPGEGLLVDPVTPRREKDGDVPYLVIEGEVVNKSDIDRDVPPLIAILSDAEGVQIQHWTFRVEVRRLKPGERVPFSTRLANPSERAAGINIVFTGTSETR